MVCAAFLVGEGEQIRPGFLLLWSIRVQLEEFGTERLLLDFQLRNQRRQFRVTRNLLRGDEELREGRRGLYFLSSHRETSSFPFGQGWVSVTSTRSARSTIDARHILTLLARCQEESYAMRTDLACRVYYLLCMDDELIKKLRAEFARQGGKARAKALTSKERKEIATKASKAAAKARSRKAKEREKATP
jgi:hypothetical protein